jgi:hypothetical protein
MVKSVKLWVHKLNSDKSADKYGNRDLLLTATDFPELSNGDLIEVYHASDPHTTRCLLQYVCGYE